MNGQAGTHASMFAAYFPGDAYTITFEPTPEQSTAMTRMVTKHAANDDESQTMLQMLGILPSVGARNPTARDAWTRTQNKLNTGDPTISKHCRNGHLRTEYTYVDVNGSLRCRQCRRIYDRARDAKRRAAA